MRTYNSRYTYFISFIVALGGFLFGFDASVISGVVGFITPQFELTDLQIGWVVSSPSFAAMFAMLFSGTASDYFGRRRILILAALLYTVSAFFSAIAPSYEVLVIARMIGGLGFGAALVLAPIYIAEIAPAEIRGKLVSVQQFNIVIGFSVSYFSNYLLLDSMEAGVGFLTEENVWRWMLGLEMAPAAIYFILMFFVPRSPRWLLLKGNEKEANSVLTKIFSTDRANSEKESIVNNINRGRTEEKARLTSLVTKRMSLVIAIALVIGVAQQITGVNAIYFYAPSIFEQSGVGTNAAFAQAVWVGIINVIFTIVAMVLIDKLGRKPLLLIGLSGVVISMFLTGYGFNQATYQLTGNDIEQLKIDIDKTKLEPLADVVYNNDLAFKNALKDQLTRSEYSKFNSTLIQSAININPILILVGILLFVASFAMSLGPVMWVLLSEIFPNKIRGLAIAVIGFINSATSTLVQFIFPWELSNFGNAITFIIFGAFGLVALVILARLLPETKGKSLEEIEEHLIIKS